ncbi:MAG: CPBP family intramembrane metalloprotease [Ruminococcus sp.]|nr:CPBP family intramembrane metalloprotease [Ruminococcus sp.]
MLPYINENETKITLYKRQLNKDSSRVGIVLLIYFVATFAITFVTILPVMLATLFSSDINSGNLDMSFMEDTTFLMLESGLVSLLTFFGVTIIYSIIVKADFGKIFPINKIGAKVTTLLCSFGLAVALTANYVSQLVIELFGAFGINANIDTDYPWDSALDVILFYVSVAILPALVEEFAFRGIILGSLRKYSDGLAVLVSGIVFGLMHGNFTQIPFATVVGLILGYIVVKTNSLLPSIIIHFLNNFLSVTMTLLSSSAALPDYLVDIINIGLTLIVAILGIVSFTILSKKHKGFFKLKQGDEIITFKEKVKIVFKSPTIIAFAVFSLLEAILMLSIEV